MTKTIIGGVTYLSTKEVKVSTPKNALCSIGIEMIHAPTSRINQMNGFSPITIPDEEPIKIKPPIQTEQNTQQQEIIDYGYGTTIYKGKEYQIIKPFGESTTNCNRFYISNETGQKIWTHEELIILEQKDKEIEIKMLAILEKQKSRIAPKTYNRIKKHLKKEKY